MKFDCAVIGGGIVGLATAMMLGRRDPGIRVVVLEKESDLAAHQSGRNSGVIHSGIYYKPGSVKARFAREGNRALVEFCQEHGIPHEVCGKVIVATEDWELPLLEKLLERGKQNGLEVTKASAGEVREVEPHVRCLAGVSVPSTGVVDFARVCHKYAELIREQGGTIHTGRTVENIRETAQGNVIETTGGAFEAKLVINCAGLHSDRLARIAGLNPKTRIVPFRGEYYELIPERKHLVKTLVYPVPNPAFPFLGVHFTRMIGGNIHAGPNAVLALKREGYQKRDLSLHDLGETVTYGAFWQLARKHYKEGMMEIYRSLSKAAFVRSLKRLIPEVRAEDLVPTRAGVRAQALFPDGNLVDDFLIVEGRNSVHVCNAPSPAATASLEIGKAVADRGFRLLRQKPSAIGFKESYSVDK